MRTAKLIASMALMSALAESHAQAQTPSPSPAPAAVAEEKAWSFSIFANTYLVPESGDYVQPAFTADRGRLHLEARYNYEDRDTGSAWVGYNFSGGDRFAWEFTPMVGGVFGTTDGVAPGYRGSLSHWKIELYSEGEYVVDLGDSSDSFFYNWSELTLAPTDWLRFGLVTQRTRAYETDRDIQRGALLGLQYKKLSLTGYMFNPDDEKPTFVLSVGLAF